MSTNNSEQHRTSANVGEQQRTNEFHVKQGARRLRVPIDDIDQWLSDRRHYIGSSEVPIVCHVDGHFASRAMLFAEKKGLRPPRQDNAAMRRGRLGEGACIEALCDERPDWQILRAKVHVIDPDLRLACTPDAAALR